jgi:hypothetical protein
LFALPRLILALCLVFPSIAWGRVFLRWTQDVVPKNLGVSELVLPCDSEGRSLIQNATSKGYRVYLECGAQRAGAIADSAAKYMATGIIVFPGDADLSTVNLIVQRLRASHPTLSFLLLNPNAVPPQMKGTLVTTKDGILQVTSPTAQPWLDTNLALVNLEKTFRPAQVPLYSISWSATGAAGEQGPDVSDYALAVAEAGAYRADLLLSAPESVQRGLANDDGQAWALWNEIKRYLRFYSHSDHNLSPEANVALITDEDPQSFEPINLLARHNIGVRIIRPGRADKNSLQGTNVIIAFPHLGGQLMQTISDSVAAGKTLVVVNADGKSYPWHSGKGRKISDDSISYVLGKGRIVELKSPISDPEKFARDIRALIDPAQIQISLWNALTTIGVLYREPDSGNKVVELVNYAADPLEVQIRVKGEFPVIRYESPERGCCEAISPVILNGFTEFSVPSLTIAGRVHLQKSGLSHPSALP